MDCDAPGRRAAEEIATSLSPAASAIELVDLWPDRHDGYDLTDRILERRRTRSRPTAPRTITSLLRPAASRQPNTPRACARRVQEDSR